MALIASFMAWQTLLSSLLPYPIQLWFTRSEYVIIKWYYYYYYYRNIKSNKNIVKCIWESPTFRWDWIRPTKMGDSDWRLRVSLLCIQCRFDDIFDGWRRHNRKKKKKKKTWWLVIFEVESTTQHFELQTKQLAWARWMEFFNKDNVL